MDALCLGLQQGWLRTFEYPKSAIFSFCMLPVPHSSRFSSFRSRCTTPWHAAGLRLRVGSGLGFAQWRVVVARSRKGSHVHG